jgi:hypothetical protein
MEWMLQVADEIDDAVSALRLCCIGVAAELGLAAVGGRAIFAKIHQNLSTARR